MSVPFPCMVYCRKRASEPFQFSHAVDRWLPLEFPRSLRVEDVRGFRLASNLRRAAASVFLVLVGGDLGQQVCLDSIGKERQRFLYPGSEFSRAAPGYRPLEELEPGYVQLAFSSAVAFYARSSDGGWGLSSLVPCESGLAVLPTRLWEADLPRWESLLRRQIDYSIRCAAGIRRHRPRCQAEGVPWLTSAAARPARPKASRG